MIVIDFFNVNQPMLKLVAYTVVVSRKVVLLNRAFAARVVCTYKVGAFCTHCSGWLAD